MIDKVFIAPKGDDLGGVLALATETGTHVELATFMQAQALDANELEAKRLNGALEGFRNQVSLHGPVYDLNPASLDPAVAKHSRKRYRQAAEAALAVQARYLVFHSQWSPIYHVATCYEAWLAATAEAYKDLVETLVQDTRLTLLIENFMDETPQVLNDLVNAIGSPHVRACLDVGHVNLFSRLSPIDWFDQLGNNVAYIHAHNNGGSQDDHGAFASGTIDMEGFLNHVSLSPYRTNLAVEVNDMQGIRDSLALLGQYTQRKGQAAAKHCFLI